MHSLNAAIQRWKPTRRQGSRMTLGILSMNLADSRVLEVYSGISEVAQETGINLICYDVGLVGLIDAPGSSTVESVHMSRVLANLISGDAVDGLLTMQFWHKREWFESFCSPYLHLPITTIARAYPGHCGVINDTYAGCRALVRHLIVAHGFTRLAFLSGHRENEIHQLRYQAFLDECADHQINVNPLSIIEFDNWNFTIHHNEDNKSRGRQAIAQLIDQRQQMPGRDFQAIVSASEMVAIGAVHALQERGYHVPHDVSVVAEEASADGALMTPPLTMVDIAWKTLGRQGAQTLIQSILGIPQPQHQKVPSLITIRHSCGCYSPEVEEVGLISQRSRQPAGHLTPISRRDILTTLEQAVVPMSHADPCWAALLHDAFMDDILDEQSVSARRSHFLRQLETQLIHWGKQHAPLIPAHAIISHLHHYALTNFASQHDHLLRAETLLQQGQIVISQLSEQLQVNRRLEQDRIINLVQEINQRLISLLDIQGLIAILYEELPQIGVERCYLSLYENPAEPDKNARLILAFDAQGRHAIPEEGLVFPAIQLAPSSLLSDEAHLNLILEPLYFGNDHIGFILFQTATQDSRIYDFLRSEISSALKGAMLIQRVNQRTREVEAANSALQASIASLKQYQHRLIQSEKMAALGQLVAGVAHEINTPIGIGVTAASFLDQESRLMRERFQSGVLKKSELAHYIDSAIESSRLILSSLSRADSLVQSFKRIAVDQTIEEVRLFGLKAYLSDVLNSLHMKLRQGMHSVEIHCPDALKLYSQPGVYYQIFTNLIMNSLLHGFDNMQEGIILIDVSVIDGAYLHIVYSDNGKGMEEATLRLMFDPFFTTKRGQGGTGLGMNIVYNLVMQQLKGSIDCISQPGQGVRFDMRIPLPEQSLTAPSPEHH